MAETVQNALDKVRPWPQPCRVVPASRTWSTMSRSLEIPATWRGLLATTLTAIMLGSGEPCAQGQRQVELISFTTTSWRYEASGADQGVAWRSTTFADTGWPSGMGLLGVETMPNIYPYPFNTVFDPYDPNIITYYFRAHFAMAASDFLFPLTLVCSNLVDDGCVVYLNSNEVHRIRVPTGQNFLTLASGGPLTEGAYEPPVNISTNALRVGDNVLAVEVHQTAPGSSDIVHGLSLTAIVPTSVSIINQPQSQTTTLGVPVVLSVGVAGGPVLYQWQRDNGSGVFTNVPGATGSSYTFTPSVAGTATYRVLVYNGVNSVTSSPAVVTAIADSHGPVMLSAIVQEEAIRTNRILIVWNEKLANTTVCPSCGTNFTVVMVASNVPVAVSNVIYSASGGPGGSPFTILLMSTTNWLRGSNYYVSVRRVRDAIGNVVAPDSRVAVSWPRHAELIQADHVWSFHSAAVFEPDIFDQPWYATNFVEGPWWGSGPGPFCGGVIASACFGPFQNEIGYQPEPSLFRTTFVVPTNSGFGAQLSVVDFVDDAVVYYLNGTEMLRYNVAPSLTPPNSQTRAIASSSGLCRSNTISVPNLPPGTNWLAAAVCQFGSLTDADMAFGLRLSHTYFVPGPLPDVPVPQLNIAPAGTNRFRLWWDGPGYALESTTNLAFTGAGAVGAWMEVTNVSNPYTDIATGQGRFFRLRQ